MSLPTIYTLGHSTRSMQELIGLLGAERVRELVDVRSAPRSHRHPHFMAGTLADTLITHGIRYRHEAALGGQRRPALRPSQNEAWQNRSLRGYADYMGSEDFRLALDRLQQRAVHHRTCLMCAEADWRRCHRRLISDALLVRGWRVLHLGARDEPAYHELTPFAVIAVDRTITYPPLRRVAQANPSRVEFR